MAARYSTTRRFIAYTPVGLLIIVLNVAAIIVGLYSAVRFALWTWNP
jgi:hypothetical protein